MLKLLGIGGLGTMLGPSAKHLLNSSHAKFIRILDRGTPGNSKDKLRLDWQQQGAQLVPNLQTLLTTDDFDGIVICAGKNGDDFQLICDLVRLLASLNLKKFILHLSTVSCQFVKNTFEFCQKHQIDYVNYPLTGGEKGALNANMLILCSGEKSIYDKLEPFLKQIGQPKYFGAAVELAAGVKLIGHVLVFHGLLGSSLAVVLQKNLFKLAEIGTEQTEFFDFLNQGAGGTKQWDVALRLGVDQGIWDKGFFIHHAIVDIFYTIQLLQDQGLPQMMMLPLCEVALVMILVLNTAPNQNLATQAVSRLLSEMDAEEINQFITKHLDSDIEKCIKNCIKCLPIGLQSSVMLDVNYN